jgi:hypothetical protein
LIVGVLVVFAVTFTRSSSAASGQRRLFSGSLGWVTLLNLTLLAGMMMALLGAKLVEGRTQMDALWLATLAAAATLTLLLILRTSWPRPRKQVMGAIWAAVVIVSVVGCDVAYPRVQRRSAMSSVIALGGKITEGDQGIVVDLAGTKCDDIAFKRLLPRLKYFANISELSLRDTAITDTGLDAIRKTWDSKGPLKRLDVTGTKVTPAALLRVKRSQEDLQTVQ